MPLPWQLGVLAYVCGVLAWAYALPAVLALILAALALARGRGLAFIFLGIGAGLAVGMPAKDADCDPVWNAQVRIRGVVDEVRTQPGQRIGIIARDVFAPETNASLPGLLLWNWENPATIPLPGQRFEGMPDDVFEERGEAGAFEFGQALEHLDGRLLHADSKLDAFYGTGF